MCHQQWGLDAKDIVVDPDFKPLYNQSNVLMNPVVNQEIGNILKLDHNPNQNKNLFLVESQIEEELDVYEDEGTQMYQCEKEAFTAQEKQGSNGEKYFNNRLKAQGLQYQIFDQTEEIYLILVKGNYGST